MEDEERIQASSRFGASGMDDFPGRVRIQMFHIRWQAECNQSAVLVPLYPRVGTGRSIAREVGSLSATLAKGSSSSLALAKLHPRHHLQ